MSYEKRAVDHFERMLAAVGERAAEIDPRPVASMWPHVGSAYRRGGVFLLGQALDGWDPDECSARWRAPEARTPEGRARIIAGTRAWHADVPEPIAPVLEIGKRRGSTYWLFTRALVEQLAPGDEAPWYGRYAWGNLYPLGHDRPKGYPTGALKEAQDEHVAALLMAQGGDARPRHRRARLRPLVLVVGSEQAIRAPSAGSGGAAAACDGSGQWARMGRRLPPWRGQPCSHRAVRLRRLSSGDRNGEQAHLATYGWRRADAPALDPRTDQNGRTRESAARLDRLAAINS